MKPGGWFNPRRARKPREAANWALVEARRIAAGGAIIPAADSASERRDCSSCRHAPKSWVYGAGRSGECRCEAEVFPRTVTEIAGKFWTSGHVVNRCANWKEARPCE